MTKKRSGVVVMMGIFLIALVVKSCKPEEPTSASDLAVTVTGKVVEAGTFLAVDSALITLTNAQGTQTGFTNRFGDYSVVVQLTERKTLQSAFNVSKPGYVSKTLTLTLNPGEVITQDLTLQPDTSGSSAGGGTATTGYPNTIAFLGASPSEISVFGVGGRETSIILAEVRDSAGNPIKATVADTVEFSIAGPPVAGGAFIVPNRVITNAIGRVSTTVNSGTVSGPIQVTARMRRDLDGKIIQSLPIRLLVHGGAPDSNHISVAATRLNLPGLSFFGLTSGITAYLGDKYGNPVAPGTAVYFSTNQGIITTTGGFTDANGQAQATLFSALPIQPNGFGTVRVTTVSATGFPIVDTMRILFSGEPVISAVQVTSGSLNVDNTTQGTISFRVTDVNGNPVSAGTTISVTIKGASAVASEISPHNKIPDTQSQSWTTFSFVVSKDQDADPPKLGPYTISIVVEHPGPYVGAKWTLTGTVN